jgi:hypothetical protein
MTGWNEDQHPRDDRGRFDEAEAARGAWSRRVEASSPASSVPHASSLTVTEPDAGEEWWDDGEPPRHAWMDSEPERPKGAGFDQMSQEMRDWRALGEPDLSSEPAKRYSPEMEELLGLDTPEGRAKMDRLRAYREAGYTGPLDQDNNIPDPDDPENWEWMSAVASLREHGA